MASWHVPLESKDFCRGWSREEVVEGLMKIDATLKGAIGSGVGNLTSASVNGKSFTFGTSTSGASTVGDLTARKDILATWLLWGDRHYYSGPSNRAVAVFPGKVSFGYPYCDSNAA